MAFTKIPQCDMKLHRPGKLWNLLIGILEFSNALRLQFDIKATTPTHTYKGNCIAVSDHIHFVTKCSSTFTAVHVWFTGLITLIR